jgi:hypothetical protein
VPLGIEGEWIVPTALTLRGTRTIEAEKIEDDLEYPILPKDSEAIFDYHGTRKKAQLKAGANVWDQAQAPQSAFWETLLCDPIEETGDIYTVQVCRPSLYPITFVRGEDRVRTWIDNTRIKVVTKDVKRSFGGKPTLELLSAPALPARLRLHGHDHRNRRVNQSRTPGS